MRIFLTIIISSILSVSSAGPSDGSSDGSSPKLYDGSMKIIKTSGRSCGSVATVAHPMTLVLERNSAGKISGYFEGEAVSLGKFSGDDPKRLTVNYPYPDQQRSSGHTMSLVEKEDLLTVLLHDRHIEAEIDDCNFDQAEMLFKRSSSKITPQKIFEQLSLRFDAQLHRSTGFALSREGSYFAAAEKYEKALEIAERAYPPGSDRLDAYSASLAGVLIKSGRMEDFNRLYESRYATLGDDANREIFNAYKVKASITIARDALKREDFDKALKVLLPVYTLKPTDKGVIVTLLSTYMRSAKYQESLAFLEDAEKKLETDEDRRDLDGAKAIVLLKLSDIDDKKGDQKGAEKWIKKAIALDTHSSQYTVALARLRHKAGKLNEAEKILDESAAKYTDPYSRELIKEARHRMQMTEMILKKLRQVGS